MDDKSLGEMTTEEQFENNNLYKEEEVNIDGKTEKVYLLIPPILVAAAGELAMALAARLGENIADEIFKKGLTGNNDAFQKEVIKQLSELNRKIDIIINFLYKELPELIRQQLSNELLRQKYIELETNLTLLIGAIATLKKTDFLSSDDIDAARRASELVAKTGEHLLRNGIEWHAAGVHAMSGLISIHSRLMKLNKKYGTSLGIYASQYADLIRPWLDKNNPKSVTSEIASREALFVESEYIIKTISEFPEFLFVINEYYRDKIDENGNKTGERIRIWVGFMGWLRKNAETWHGDWSNSGRGIENPTSPEQFPWRVFAGYNEINKLPIGPIDKEGRWHYFGIANKIVNDAQHHVNTLPDKIKELKSTEATLKHLLASCEKLIPLAKIG